MTDPIQVNLNDHDLEILTSVADQITGPIVTAIAAIAAERDTAIQALRVATDHLADIVVILESIGWEPTYAVDRDNWDAARAALSPTASDPSA